MICGLRLEAHIYPISNTARGGRRHRNILQTWRRRCILSESGMIQYIICQEKNIQFADAAAAKNYLLNIRPDRTEKF